MMCLNKNVARLNVTLQLFKYYIDINVVNYLLFQKIISIYK